MAGVDMQGRQDLSVLYYLLRLSTSILLVLFIFFNSSVSQASYSDEEWLALNIYHESRGEHLMGKIAVAIVTLNRVDAECYPNTIKGVVTQKRQFSWYDGSKTFEIKEKNKYELCLSISKAILKFWHNETFKKMIGQTVLNGVKWYHSKEVKPSWSKGKDVVVVIGDHLFYGDI
jgi:spore germination cell wall hydrolase CwlJ-like protein